MFDNKTILITGGTGSWGNELTKQLLEKFNPKEIRIYSRGEHKQVRMKINFSGESKIKYYVGDVRDKNRLKVVSKNTDYIFHLAALKHVPVCEENPWEAVLTNIYGTRNVIESAIENNVKRVIYVSTDKAVDPFNLYGVCKACGEKMIIAANKEESKTSFVCVRGGNVIGTNGSVIPLFKEQIKKNNEITITDDRMSRFFLPLSEAISLVFKAAKDAMGGEVFVLKMPSIKIKDLAEVMIQKLGSDKTKIKKIGIRPGEKIYEVLVSRYEVPRCVEHGEYLVILPQIKILQIGKKYENKKLFGMEEFNSENTKIISKEEMADLLKKEGWLEKDGIKKGFYYGKELSGKELRDVFSVEDWKN